MSKRNPEPQRRSMELGFILSAGMVFPVSIAIGYAMGYGLDRWLGTRYFTPVFLLFGIAAGFVSFFRTIAGIERIEKQDNDRDGSS